MSWGSKPNASASIIYTNAEDYMHFPFTVGNSYTDVFSGTLNTSSTFYRKGTVTATADGSGTLITPAGTFTNVIRIHFVESYQDSANFGVPYIINYGNDEYIWYQPGIHSALLAITTLTNSIGAPSSSSLYLSSIPTGVNNTDASVHLMSSYPNPASQEYYLFINDEGLLSNAQLKIFDMMGHLVKAESVTNRNSRVDVSSLAPGVYLTEFSTNGVTVKKERLVIER
jgi:hypothetical protein